MATKSKNLKEGIKYSLSFDKKKLFGIFIGEFDDVYYFVDPDTFNEYGKSKKSADILIDKMDKDVLITRVYNKRNDSTYSREQNKITSVKDSTHLSWRTNSYKDTKVTITNFFNKKK